MRSNQTTETNRFSFKWFRKWSLKINPLKTTVVMVGQTKLP